MTFAEWRVGTEEISEYRALRGFYFNVLTRRSVGAGPLYVFRREPFTWPIRTDLDRPFDWEQDAVSGEFANRPTPTI